MPGKLEILVNTADNPVYYHRYQGAYGQAHQDPHGSGHQGVAVPSKTNICTRWLRLAPTARAMPISDLRAAASMTKMRKIRRIPTRDREQTQQYKEGGYGAAYLLRRVKKAPFYIKDSNSPSSANRVSASRSTSLR